MTVIASATNLKLPAALTNRHATTTAKPRNWMVLVTSARVLDAPTNLDATTTPMPPLTTGAVTSSPASRLDAPTRQRATTTLRCQLRRREAASLCLALDAPTQLHATTTPKPPFQPNARTSLHALAALTLKPTTTTLLRPRTMATACSWGAPCLWLATTTTNANSDDGSCEYESCAGCLNPLRATTMQMPSFLGHANLQRMGTIAMATAWKTRMETAFVIRLKSLDAPTPKLSTSTAMPQTMTVLVSSLTEGCVDPSACNYDDEANTDDGSCEFTSCAGCLNESACNYDPTAIYPAECEFPEYAYNCDGTCIADNDGDGICNPFEILAAPLQMRATTTLRPPTTMELVISSRATFPAAPTPSRAISIRKRSSMTVLAIS